MANKAEDLVKRILNEDIAGIGKAGEKLTEELAKKIAKNEGRKTYQDQTVHHG